MKKINIILGSLVLGVVMALSGCESLDQYPKDYFTNDNFWQDAAEVSGYMTGLHDYLRSSYSNHFYMGELRGGLLGDGDDGSGVSVFGESLYYQTIIKQDLREDNAFFDNWNGLYADIVRVNLAIEKIPTCSFLSDSQKALYLAQAYGMRAYYYFFLYRTWGSVPLITDVAIMDGKVSAAALSRPRANASEIMKLMKQDIDESEKQYAAAGSNGWQDKYTWSLYATLMLKANIYAWAAEVTTGDQTATGTADLQTAKAALQEIISSGKFKLMPQFYQAFRSDYKDKNTENILAVPYNKTDGDYFPNISYALAQSAYFTTAYDLDNQPLTLDQTQEYGTYTLVNGIVRYQYKESFWLSFDENDTRRDATFFPVKIDTRYDATYWNIGLLVKKFAGTYSTAEGVHYFDDDGPVYRYAEVLLLMAEIENDLGNDPSPYINEIRKRAYGSAYTPYTNQSKYENTKAILEEDDKEFVFEGKRWFNLIRMKDASGKSLVFDESVNYPFDIYSEDPTGPVISSSEAYKVLWPLSTSTMNNDPVLKQTDGYKTAYNR